MSTDTAVDLVVIGLGPGGEHLATEAAKAGLTVVGIDERLVGGECPYYGCIPSKMVIRAANLLADARRVGTLAGAAEVSPDWGVVHARIRDEATDDWDDTVAVERLEKAGVRFVRGHGRLVDTGVVEVGGTRYAASRGVVLNTGTWPSAPPVDGLADTPFWTNRDVLATPDLPASMVVIGGGAIGAELAQAFARFGTTVSLVEAAPRILALEEPESSDVVARAMAADGIQVLAGAKIGSVHHADGRFTVSLTDAGGTALDLASDRLLVAAGRRPNISDLGLETVGLDPTARSVDTDARMRAGDKLWAIGDIVGKGAFTHMSMYQANVALADITNRDDAPEAEYHAVPRVTFTDPEVGAVGLTEQQARDAGLDVAVGLAPLAESTRGWITGPGGEGLIKLVEDRAAGHLVGATSVGPMGGEVLSMLATAVHARIPTATLARMPFAYPTFHRAVETALADLRG
jgi:pyruvate/2-oxoglutarate dehydrogenase complex dihydrolipoamide dehydrogenase (E3) component